MREELQDREAELRALREKLQRMKENQRFAEMANDRYYTDGSKRIDDAEIVKVERRIKELETH